MIFFTVDRYYNEFEKSFMEAESICDLKTALFEFEYKTLELIKEYEL